MRNSPCKLNNFDLLAVTNQPPGVSRANREIPCHEMALVAHFFMLHAHYNSASFDLYGLKYQATTRAHELDLDISAWKSAVAVNFAKNGFTETSWNNYPMSKK